MNLGRLFTYFFLTFYFVYGLGLADVVLNRGLPLRRHDDVVQMLVAGVVLGGIWGLFWRSQRQGSLGGPRHILVLAPPLAVVTGAVCSAVLGS